MKSILSGIIIFLVAGSCFAQEVSPINQSRADSLSATPNDTLLTSQNDTSKSSSGIDSVIYANSSDSLIFKVVDKKMDLYGNSEMKYKNTDLKSEKINVDFNTSTVNASGKFSDTANSKSRGVPVLSEGREVYTGETIKYNFKTTQGFITQAGTQEDGSYYTGEKIKKVNPETYFIEDGIYTTCNHNPPHYYFYSPKMKVIQNSQIIARWIWLYFGGVPFPVPLPFAVFPIQSGRRSGIIAPVIGDDANYGNYLSHFGYFWAINDNMDVNLTADYYTRGSFALSSRFRYVKRYDFNGQFEASYKKFKLGESTDPGASTSTDWRLYWTHHQNFTPTLRFDANLQFLSSNFLRRTSINFNQLLENQIVSNATLSKTWSESGNSMSLSYSRNQNLESGNIHEVLPSITFNKSQSYPFRSEYSSGSDQKWYELFGYSYNGQFQNRRDKSGGVFTTKGGFLHNINASLSPKFGHISVTPNFRYQEKWYNSKIEEHYAGVQNYKGSDSLIVNQIKGPAFVRTFSLGVSANTRLYGIFNPHMLGIASIRHTILSSISYNYQPDFSRPGWGYYGTYVDSKGNEVKYDKYQEEIFRGASRGEQQNISLSIGNIFEMKTEVDPTDTTSHEKKIQLLNLNAGISYNFAADSLKFSDINVGYRTQVGNILNFQGSSSYTLYDYKKNIGKINKFLVNEGKGLVRMTNFNFSISLNLSGERSGSAENVVTGDTSSGRSELQLEQQSSDITRGLYNMGEADFSIPWDISLNYNYSVSSPTPFRKDISSNLSANLNFNLTKNWKFSLTGSYDFNRNEFVAPQVRISRDLHAWIMNFTWNPIGYYTGYMLEIRVKAPQLSDLKVTKRDQFFSGR